MKKKLLSRIWQALSQLEVSIEIVKNKSALLDSKLDGARLSVCATQRELEAGMAESICSTDALALEIEGATVTLNRQYDGRMSEVPRLPKGALPLADILAVEPDGSYAYLVVGITQQGSVFPAFAMQGQSAEAAAAGRFYTYRYLNDQRLLRASVEEGAPRTIALVEAEELSAEALKELEQAANSKPTKKTKAKAKPKSEGLEFEPDADNIDNSIDEVFPESSAQAPAESQEDEQNGEQ